MVVLWLGVGPCKVRKVGEVIDTERSYLALDERAESKGSEVQS